uniref:Uncharacterized protein n=1 Tax=Trichobilharzia regenti TaxID=157069 RepID=A0AA85KEC3_TRIRE|nr:unnamed protein product [Trichobilharzia regenti]
MMDYARIHYCSTAELIPREMCLTIPLGELILGEKMDKSSSSSSKELNPIIRNASTLPRTGNSLIISSSSSSSPVNKDGYHTKFTVVNGQTHSPTLQKNNITYKSNGNNVSVNNSGDNYINNVKNGIMDSHTITTTANAHNNISNQKSFIPVYRGNFIETTPSPVNISSILLLQNNHISPKINENSKRELNEPTRNKDTDEGYKYFKNIKSTSVTNLTQPTYGYNQNSKLITYGNNNNNNNEIHSPLMNKSSIVLGENLDSPSTTDISNFSEEIMHNEVYLRPKITIIRENNSNYNNSNTNNNHIKTNSYPELPTSYESSNKKKNVQFRHSMINSSLAVSSQSPQLNRSPESLSHENNAAPTTTHNNNSSSSNSNNNISWKINQPTLYSYDKATGGKSTPRIEIENEGSNSRLHNIHEVNEIYWRNLNDVADKQYNSNEELIIDASDSERMLQIGNNNNNNNNRNNNNNMDNINKNYNNPRMPNSHKHYGHYKSTPDINTPLVTRRRPLPQLSKVNEEYVTHIARPLKPEFTHNTNGNIISSSECDLYNMLASEKLNHRRYSEEDPLQQITTHGSQQSLLHQAYNRHSYHPPSQSNNPLGDLGIDQNNNSLISNSRTNSYEKITNTTGSDHLLNGSTVQPVIMQRHHPTHHPELRKLSNTNTKVFCDNYENLCDQCTTVHGTTFLPSNPTGNNWKSHLGLYASDETLAQSMKSSTSGYEIINGHLNNSQVSFHNSGYDTGNTTTANNQSNNNNNYYIDIKSNGVYRKINQKQNNRVLPRRPHSLIQDYYNWDAPNSCDDLPCTNCHYNTYTNASSNKNNNNKNSIDNYPTSMYNDPYGVRSVTPSAFNKYEPYSQHVYNTVTGASMTGNNINKGELFLYDYRCSDEIAKKTGTWTCTDREMNLSSHQRQSFKQTSYPQDVNNSLTDICSACSSLSDYTTNGNNYSCQNNTCSSLYNGRTSPGTNWLTSGSSGKGGSTCARHRNLPSLPNLNENQQHQLQHTRTLTPSQMNIPTVAWRVKDAKEHYYDKKLLRLIEQLPRERQNSIGLILLAMDVKLINRNSIKPNHNNNNNNSDDNDIYCGGLEYRLREALELVQPKKPAQNNNYETSLHTTEFSNKSFPNKIVDVRTRKNLNEITNHSVNHHQQQQQRKDESPVKEDGRESGIDPDTLDEVSTPILGNSLSLNDMKYTNGSSNNNNAGKSNTLTDEINKPNVITVLRRLARCLAIRIANKRHNLASANQHVARNSIEEKLLRYRLSELNMDSGYSDGLMNSWNSLNSTEPNRGTIVNRFDRWHNNTIAVIQLLCQLARRLATLDAQLYHCSKHTYQDSVVLLCNQEVNQSPLFSSVTNITGLNVSSSPALSSSLPHELFHEFDKTNGSNKNEKIQILEQQRQLITQIKEAQSLRAELETCRRRLLESIPPNLKCDLTHTILGKLGRDFNDEKSNCKLSGDNNTNNHSASLHNSNENTLNDFSESPSTVSPNRRQQQQQQNGDNKIDMHGKTLTITYDNDNNNNNNDDEGSLNCQEKSLTLTPTTTTSQFLRQRVAEHLIEFLNWFVLSQIFETEIKVDQDLWESIQDELRLELSY